MIIYNSLAVLKLDNIEINQGFSFCGDLFTVISTFESSIQNVLFSFPWFPVCLTMQISMGVKDRNGFQDGGR